MDHTAVPRPLKDYSEEELLEEISRRQEKKPPLPIPLAHPSFDMLRKEVDAYIRWMADSDYNEDQEQILASSIYETAVSSFYGTGVWSDYIMPMQKWQAHNQKISCPNCSKEVLRINAGEPCPDCGTTVSIFDQTRSS